MKISEIRDTFEARQRDASSAQMTLDQATQAKLQADAAEVQAEQRFAAVIESKGGAVLDAGRGGVWTVDSAVHVTFKQTVSIDDEADDPGPAPSQPDVPQAVADRARFSGVFRGNTMGDIDDQLHESIRRHLASSVGPMTAVAPSGQRVHLTWAQRLQIISDLLQGKVPSGAPVGMDPFTWLTILMQVLPFLGNIIQAIVNNLPKPNPTPTPTPTPGPTTNPTNVR